MAERPLIDDAVRERSLFLVWGPPSYGPRSRVFAAELGVPIEFVFSTRKRGWVIAPWKYGYQAVRTLWLFLRRRPRLVFVQSPPSFAVMAAFLHGALTGARFVVDAHSQAMVSRYWTRPRWLHRYLTRKALATIVTNDAFARRIEQWGGRALVLRDIPTTFATGSPLARDDRFLVLAVCTFAPDEPLAELMAAADALPNVHFYVTGNLDRADPQVVQGAPDNVEFTGYIPNDVYYATMEVSDAVMCLTTRDNTMQRGACEALSMGTPIVTSDWPLLRDYFSRGTVHVAPTSDAISEGVETMKSDHERFVREIGELRSVQQKEWDAASAALASLIRS